MTFLCYPKCSTCRKAQAWLDSRSIAYELRDIKEHNPTIQELTEWHRRSGLPLRRFFNTSGLQYRALGLKDRLPSMGEDEQLALLSSDGMLVKRPMLIAEDFVLVGFKEADWAAKLEP
ncbi:arsenate reductase family protein [Pseudoflavonifractor sp. HCP28S3_F10]|uniref:arsenate reductase family protein n=1 Tax=Pseudoflavonifractor sp. HCP28S3_F10 TaxID=3438947 RepID=UPI003F89684C